MKQSQIYPIYLAESNTVAQQIHMSFFDLEAQHSAASTRDSDQSASGADNLISQFAEELKQLGRECSKIATKRDSPHVRNSIESELIPLCSSLRDRIEEIRWSNNGQRIPQGSKLHNDFRMLKETFQRLQRDYNNKKTKPVFKKQTKEVAPKAVRDEPEGYVSIKVNEQTPLLLQEESDNQQQQQQQQQQQMFKQVPQNTISQDELDFNTIIHQERSQQINRIHSAVQEVNAIFHQLGSLVHEQGEQVDTIDGNIGNLSNNVQKANEQLNRADEHQRQRNKCGLITLIIIIVVVLVVILAVLS